MEIEGYLLHPALIDACFQPGNMDRRHCFGIESTHYSFVPLKLGRLEVYSPLRTKELVVYFRKKMVTIRYSIGDLFIFSQAGSLVVYIENFEAYGIDPSIDRSANTFDKLAHCISWMPVLDKTSIAGSQFVEGVI